MAVRCATAGLPFLHSSSTEDIDDDDEDDEVIFDEEFDCEDVYEDVNEEGTVEPNCATASAPADHPISESAKSPPPYM